MSDGPRVSFKVDKSITYGNIVTVLVFIVGFAIQFAVLQSSVADHERRLKEIEVRLKFVEDAALLRGAELESIDKNLDRIYLKLDSNDDLIRALYEKVAKR